MSETAGETKNQPETGAEEEVKAEAAPAEETAETAEAAGPAQEFSAKLEEAEKKIAENYDLYVRAMAELENTRRRSAVDVEKAHKYGIEKFATNLLPVIDSLEKAAEHAKNEEGPMKEGLLAIGRQLIHAMEVSGMKSFSPLGEAFDPNRHQAVTMVPAAEGQKPGTVAQVFQTGWMIQDRVLRPAMVAVVQG